MASLSSRHDSRPFFSATQKRLFAPGPGKNGRLGSSSMSAGHTYPEKTIDLPLSHRGLARQINRAVVKLHQKMIKCAKR
jgi:hypothetical protein